MGMSSGMAFYYRRNTPGKGRGLSQVAEIEKDAEVRRKGLERECGEKPDILCFTILPKMAGLPQFNPKERESQERSDLLIMGQEGENISYVNQKKQVQFLAAQCKNLHKLLS